MASAKTKTVQAKAKAKRDLGPASVDGYHRIWITEKLYRRITETIQGGKKDPEPRLGVRGDLKVLTARGRVAVGSAEKLMSGEGTITFETTTPTGQNVEGSLDNPFAADGPACGMAQVFYFGGPQGELSSASSCGGSCPGGMECVEQYRFTVVTMDNGDTYDAAAGRCTCSH